MGTSCHTENKDIDAKAKLTIALAGNPNVGKSTVFNQLTGMNVVTANYPGKTVDISIGQTTYKGRQVNVIDLPGTYGIGAVSEDQWVARQALFEKKPDVVVVILDATNLERNLVMALQLIELGFKVVVGLNLVDQLQKHGLQIDYSLLADLLGVAVVPTIANTGKGLNDLVKKSFEVAEKKKKSKRVFYYGADIEKPLDKLASKLKDLDKPPYNLPPKALATLLLENDKDFVKKIEKKVNGNEVINLLNKLRREVESKHREDSYLRLTIERHGLAGMITSRVVTPFKETKPLSERLWKYTTAPVTGMTMLVVVLFGIFSFLFFGGNFLSLNLSNFWLRFISPSIIFSAETIFGKGVMSKMFIWGFDDGINAALTVGIPYILVFYFILAILEDSGYLNSAAFLSDRIMHKFGLHGRSIIPMVAGCGCSVPAIMGTRVLESKRERTIASILITLIPCSARTAVILGSVAIFSGFFPALTLYLVVLIIIALVGIGLNKAMPGKSTGLVMEIFSFRTPSFKTVMKKTWRRFSHFVRIATPIIVVGSAVLGYFYETKLLWYLSKPLSPIVVGWLGLPSFTGIVLIFGVLRKELALQLLITLAVAQHGAAAKNLLLFMDKGQIFIFALVTTLYIPCIATIAVLRKELGTKRAFYISSFTIVLAVLVGGLFNQAIHLFA